MNRSASINENVVRIMRAIILANFTLCLTGIFLPADKVGRLFFLVGGCGLMVSVVGWTAYFFSMGDFSAPPEKPMFVPKDLNLPWRKILAGMMGLKLQYVPLLNLACCAFALSEGRDGWLVLAGFIFPLAMLFLIGQAVVLRKTGSNVRIIGPDETPGQFRLHLAAMGLLYLFTSVLPLL
jgi:hypothetical protein